MKVELTISDGDFTESEWGELKAAAIFEGVPLGVLLRRRIAKAAKQIVAASEQEQQEVVSS